jgi:glycerol-3-phosphate dehydrogenase
MAGERVTGWKTLEAALQKTASGETRSALSRFAGYQDVTKTLASMKSRNRRSGDVTMDAMQDSMEMNVQQNMRYLELQQRMQEESIGHECLSNLMKARAESVKNSLSAIQ